MHTFQPRWPADPDWEPPSPTEFVFRDALDVVSYSELEPLTTWYTYPNVWHLDDEGRWRCCSKGSSIDSVRRFAREPERVLACRRTLVHPPCPDNWVILESRHRRPDRYEVCEEDAWAFVTLRRRLAVVGIALLDVVVFDQDSSSTTPSTTSAANASSVTNPPWMNSTSGLAGSDSCVAAGPEVAGAVSLDVLSSAAVPAGIRRDRVRFDLIRLGRTRVNCGGLFRIG